MPSSEVRTHRLPRRPAGFPPSGSSPRAGPHPGGQAPLRPQRQVDGMLWAIGREVRPDGRFLHARSGARKLRHVVVVARSGDGIAPVGSELHNRAPVCVARGSDSRPTVDSAEPGRTATEDGPADLAPASAGNAGESFSLPSVNAVCRLVRRSALRRSSGGAARLRLGFEELYGPSVQVAPHRLGRELEEKNS
jgi:hypothetical protein